MRKSIKMPRPASGQREADVIHKEEGGGGDEEGGDEVAGC
jgi:hypothetical protein